VTGATTTWTLRRSRAPDLLAATMVSASGGAAMASDGWLWWAGVAALAAGLIALLFSARRHMQTVRLAIGERVRLEPLNPGSPEALSAASRARAHARTTRPSRDGSTAAAWSPPGWSRCASAATMAAALTSSSPRAPHHPTSCAACGCDC